MRTFQGSALLVVLTGLLGCAGASAPSRSGLTPTSDPVTRLVATDTAAALRAAASTLRGMGFEVAEPASAAGRVFSEPLVIQSTWRSRPIADRVLCGVGLAAPSDLNRINALANSIPITLRLGFEVEPRSGTTATTVLFVAEGRRPETVVAQSPTMSCTLTMQFVNEIFQELEATLRTDGESGL